MKTSYRLKGNQKVHIIPLSDLHIGSEQFNQDYFEYCLDKIDNIKSDKRILLCGDLLEASSKMVGNSAFHTTMTLDEQIDTAINFFKPYRKDIVVSIEGNHCARLSKDFDLNVMKIIAKALHCETGHQYFDTFMINGKPFTIYVRHGRGSSMHAHTAQGKTIRETATITADLYAEGHNHRLDFFSQPIRTPEGLKRKTYVFTGSFLKYNGYADAMQLPILPEAFQTISINQDLIVRNTAHYIDQMAPELMEV